MHAAAKLTDMDSRLVLAAALFLIITSLSFAASYCYQESTNVSTTCGGLVNTTAGYGTNATWNGSWADGSWTTYTTSGTNQLYYVNYTKPTYALRESSLWKVKLGSQTISRALTTACWDANPTQINLQIVKFKSGIISLGEMNCWNGASWVGLETGIDSDIFNGLIYEEAMNWSIGNITACNTTINESGKWFVDSDLSCTADVDVIIISSHNVTLDLNGHTLYTNATIRSSIFISNNYSNVLIKNGKLSGGKYGLYSGAGAVNLTLNNLTVTNSSDSCMELDKISDSVVSDINISICGDDGIESSGGSAYNSFNNINITTAVNQGLRILTMARSNFTNMNITNVQANWFTNGCTFNNFTNISIYGGYAAIIQGTWWSTGGQNNTFNNVLISGTNDSYPAIQFDNGAVNNTINNLVITNATKGIYLTVSTTLVNVEIYNTTSFFITSTGGTQTFTNLTLGYNSTVGLVKWPSVNMSTDLVDWTNTYFQPRFVSIKDANITFNTTPATIKISAPSASNVTIYKKSGFPASEAEILSSGSFYGVATIASSIATFSVPGFSGYALMNTSISGNPSVSFVSPTPANGSSIFTTQNITVNSSVASLFDISNITIYFYDVSGNLLLNVTQVGNYTYYNYTWATLPTGQPIYYNSTVYDVYGNYGDSETRQFTIVDFNLTLVSYPADYSTQFSSLVNITYNITFIYPPTMALNCSLYQDTTYKGSTEVLAAGVYSTTGTFADGLHTWNITCMHSATGGIKETSNLNVNIISSNFSGVILLSANQTVLSGSQVLFYDQVGSLNLMYFTNQSGIEYINYFNINNTNIVYNFSQPLNQTKAFFVAMRENDDMLKILTFSKNNSTYHLIWINSTNMYITNHTDTRFAYVQNNSYYDPYRYAYTRHFDTLSLTANQSSYVFVIPMLNQSVYARMYVGNDSIQRLWAIPYTAVNATSYGGVFTTIANDSTLENWIVSNFSVGTTAAANFSTYYINYTDTGLDAAKLVFENTGIKMTAPNWNKTKVYYEYSVNSTYQIIINTTHMAIFRYPDLINISIYNISNPITNPSHFVFIDSDTFIFFSNETDGNIAYSCFFGGGSGNCTRIKQNSYSQNITYYRGSMATSDKDIFTNTYGTVSSSGAFTKLTFQSSIYDYKFRCYDEMAETRDIFSIQIYTDNSSTILIPQIYGYAASSGSFGSGTRKFYQTCYGGTNRLFLFGVGTAYPLSGYSLLIPKGQYFTFTVTTSMSNPILNATITATRFSPDNAAYVTIEQGLTDSQGKATLFLESNILYKMSIVADEYNPLTFDYIPINGSNYISAVMRTNATVTFNSIPVGYNNNIMYGLFPPPGNYNNTINLSFVIIDPDATLEYYGIDIYRRDSRGYETLWYNNTVYGQPYGGTITVNLPTNYSYRPFKYFKVFNNTEYHILDDTYLIGSAQKAFAAIAEKLQDTGFIKGWYLYFIGIFFAMLSVGFVSKYSPEGAGVIGLIVLWGFTMFAPAAVILDMSIAGTPIQAWMVSTLTTVCVGAVMYLRQYWT